jgi:PKD repeat protein
LQKNILKERKKLFLFLSLLLIFGLFLTGCNWFENGIINVFDPQAQIRVDYRLDGLTAQGIANISFTIFSLNEVEFIGEKFLFEYYVDGNKIPELTRVIGATFYVPPNPLSSFDNPVSIPKDGEPGFPVYFQDVIDYMILNPMVVELDATITVMGTDGAGHNLSKTITFDLPANLPGIDFEPPTAVINVTPGTTGNAPFTVQFDASGSTDDRGIASYSWDFGDGSTGTGVMPPAHTYVSGVYIAKLTVTDYWDNKGYATVVINVGDSAVGAPIATIQVSPSTTGNAPFTVAFDGSGSSVSSESDCGCSIASYSWDFGDGSSGTGIATTHTYNDHGTYVVILSVTDTNGKVGYATVVITVTSGEDPNVDSITLYANPETNIPGGISTITAVVTNTEGDPVPDGTIVNFVTNNGTLSATTANTVNGIATVDLTLSATMQDGETTTVTAFVGSVSDSIDITCISESAEGPTAVINITPDPAEGIVPFEVYFNASNSTSGSSIVSYEWDFGDGTTGSGITTTHTYNEVGSYTVILTVTDVNGKSDFAYEGIIVTKLPEAIINTVPNVSAGTEMVEGNKPLKVYFDAYQSTSESGIVSYEWDFGDGTIGSGITANHTYDEVGAYVVYLTITDKNSFEAYDYLFVTVSTIGDVRAVIKTTPDAEQPTGDYPFTVGFDASDSSTLVSGATIVSYTWDFIDNTGTETVIHNETPIPIPVEVHTFNNPGTYLVQLTVEDSGGNMGYAFKSIKVTDPTLP